MKFNEKIIRLRKNKGMTQGDLASAVGVSRQAVYKWESAQSYPEVTKLLELKLIFGVSIDDLLDENYEVATPERKKKSRSKKPSAELTEKETVIPVKDADIVEDNTDKEIIDENADNIEESQKIEDKEQVAESITAPVLQNKVSDDKNETLDAELKFKTEKDSENVISEKKVGFFGRLFGKK